MTVEIRELVIKTTVSDNKPADNQSPSGAKTGTRGLIDSCVTEVLKILKREQER
jgi:hypothetical protein